MSEIQRVKADAQKMLGADRHPDEPLGFRYLARLIVRLCDIIDARGIEAEREVHVSERTR